MIQHQSYTIYLEHQMKEELYKHMQEDPSKTAADFLEEYGMEIRNMTDEELDKLFSEIDISKFVAPWEAWEDYDE